MANCRNCGKEVPRGDRYCPNCGAPQSQPLSEQLPLPFSPWTPPQLAPATAGGATAAQNVGPPLTALQTALIVGAILLIIAVGMIIYAVWRPFSSTGSANIPVIGISGEVVQTGSTAWGVAFTDSLRVLDGRPAARGQFFAVGVIIANRGTQPMKLSASSLALLDGSAGTRYSPDRVGWGTPEEIDSGRSVSTYTLPPGEMIAGIAFFDTPRELSKQRLLIRDLLNASPEFTGAIDLTKQSEQQSTPRIPYPARSASHAI